MLQQLLRKMRQQLQQILKVLLIRSLMWRLASNQYLIVEVSLSGGVSQAQLFRKLHLKQQRISIARGEKVCTGLCLVSGVSEGLAFVCSTVKVIPYRGRIYVGAKIVSKNCMTYRNLCAGEGC